MRTAFLTYPQFPGGEAVTGLGTILLEPLHIKKQIQTKESLISVAVRRTYRSPEMNVFPLPPRPTLESGVILYNIRHPPQLHRIGI